MKKSFVLIFVPLLATGCRSGCEVRITNDSDLDRNEIVQMDMDDVEKVFRHEKFRILDAEGREIPYQVTYDRKVVFPVKVGARSDTSYSLEDGIPAPVDTVACGAFYPERKDDLAWENDRCAFRAYGPALAESGEQAYGYDIWTKSVHTPVVDYRYREALAGRKNFHEDNGDGMDVYSVGATLGGGTAALVDSTGNIVYPGCFSSYEILDNGPLRFTVRLDYDASGESRLITLDAGEFLNRTEVTFGKSDCRSVAAGIVIHRQNPDGYILSPGDGYMAYADLTDNADNGNGVIYVGVVTPEVDSMINVPLATPRGDALGHILARKSYKPGNDYVYYWGSGWSKGDMPDWAEWKKYLSEFNRRLRQPLSVEIRMKD